MQYALLIYENEARFATNYNPDELQQYLDFGNRHKDAIQGGKALQPTQTARTIRVRNGETLTTDGPFAETKEQLGGFYLVEADSIEQAAKIAAEIPGARFGSVEIRPVMKFD